MPNQKLTNKAVANAKPPATGRVRIWDTSVGVDTTLPGSFGLQVTERGVKSWVVMCRIPDARNPRKRKQRFVTLGHYPSLPLGKARDIAREILRQAGQGIDPVEAAGERRREKAAIKTIDEAVNDFIERYAKRNNRSWKETERVFRTYLLPKWKGRPLPSINPADIHEVLDALMDTGNPYMANRLLATVRKFFNWCHERNWISEVPTEGIKAPGKEEARERILNKDEIKAVWNASKDIGWPFGPFVRLLFLTGQRRSEVANMRWDDINSEKSLWTLPKEATKSDRLHEVPLSPAAVEILQDLPRKADFVFSTSGRSPISGFSKAKKSLDRLSEVTDWQFHDIRRTVASGMAEIDIAPHVIEKVLNHATGQISGVAAVYNRHTYLEQKERALTAWAKALEVILGREPDNVVVIQP